jgi:hypothetical protein
MNPLSSEICYLVDPHYVAVIIALMKFKDYKKYE